MKNKSCIPFHKMHGLGNDFAVIDGTQKKYVFTAEQIQQMADRHLGIGFDQLLLLEPPTIADADYYYRIFNADGGEVSQCGNGARCMARYIKEQGLSDKEHICLQTHAGKLQLHYQNHQHIEVQLEAPKFAPADIPFTTTMSADWYDFYYAERKIPFALVNVGNPHAVISVQNLQAAEIPLQAQALAMDPRFSEGVNVNVMQKLSNSKIQLRVFERGAGETLACGSGACAAAVVAMQYLQFNSEVVVQQAGGDLKVQWRGGHHLVHLVGPASNVYFGEYFLQFN